MIEQFISQYLDNYKNYKDRWNYEDGCVLKGANDLFKSTGEKKYYNFILKYVEGYIDGDGNIKGFDHSNHCLDDINSGKVLFDLLERTCEEKYRKAIFNLYRQILSQPRTRAGSFWHKDIYPNQVWLDGLYMVMPFYVKFEKLFGSRERLEDVYNQFKLVRKHMWNPEKGLYYHGYDESRKEAWANKQTGLSPNFWGRAEGWFVMALADTISEADEFSYGRYKDIRYIFEEAIEGLIKYQDNETGMWYQVLDKGGESGNYLETSATLMIAYSILRGCRLGYLPAGYREYGLKAFNGTVQRYLACNDGKFALGGICKVAGLGNTPYRDGSYEYYISEKVVCNDPKGAGALLMAYSEVLDA